MPEVVKKHFEDKRGYANYYFNKLNRDRVWKAWTARGDFAGPDGPWSLTGPLPAAAFPLGSCSATVDAVLKLPAAARLKWTPATTGGLAAAARQRRPAAGPLPLAAAGGRARAFGEVSYLGTAPLPGRDGLVDVLVGVAPRRGVPLHFDPAEGNLRPWRCTPTTAADPCEIYFSDYHEVDGRLLPGGWKSATATRSSASSRLESDRFEKTRRNVKRRSDCET